MATDKKSFILYSDLLTVIKKITEQDRVNKTNDAGELFLHILEYVNDNNPNPVNFLVDMAFEPIKLSLKRDLKKYDSYIEKQSVNGKKGGRPKKAELSEITQPFILEPKKADSVSVSDSVNDKVININTALPFSFMKSLLDLGANKDLVTDWIKVRKNKKATNSETAFNGFKNQYELTGLNINQVLTECIEKSWSGFKAEWMTNNNNTNNKKQIQYDLTQFTNSLRAIE
jgi:hypothetical protein